VKEITDYILACSQGDGGVCEGGYAIRGAYSPRGWEAWMTTELAVNRTAVDAKVWSDGAASAVLCD